MTVTDDIKAGEVLWLDPANIIPDPANPRGKLRAIPALAENIKNVGQLEAITVRLIPGSNGSGPFWYVVRGHRRHAAGLRLAKDNADFRLRGILEAGATEGMRALGRMSENLQRDDFSPTEEAQGVQQLLDLGMDVATIARDLSIDPERIQGAASIAGSKAATTVTEKYDLSFDQAMVIAEFDGDKEAIKTLTVLAKERPRDWDHVVSRMRRQRDDERVEAEAAAKWIEKGYTILEDSPWGASDEKGARLDWLKAAPPAKGNLAPKDHKNCPGRAVYLIVMHDQKVRAVECCTDWRANGHKTVSQGGGTARASDKPAPDSPAGLKLRQERREHLACINAGRAAEVVRREFVRGLLKRKAPAKGTLRFATERIMGQRIDDCLDMFCDLTGLTKPGGYSDRVHEVQSKFLEGLTETQLPLALFARVAADIETEWQPNTWRTTRVNVKARRKAYLALLMAAGYTPSTVERVQGFGARAAQVLSEADAEKVRRKAAGSPMGKRTAAPAGPIKRAAPVKKAAKRVPARRRATPTAKRVPARKAARS